jgi:S-adenosylmethionine hydrolase
MTPIANPTSTITLLSDFGEVDSYVAEMKGVLLSLAKEHLQIVDISHSVSQFSVLRATDLLRRASTRYPVGTIHLCVVDPGVGSSRRALIVKSWVENPNIGRVPAFFVGPDNGIFTPFLDEDMLLGVWEVDSQRTCLTMSDVCTFDGRELFAPAAAHLANGVSPSELGRKLSEDNFVRVDLPKPARQSDTITGQILWFDSFGNAETNISTGETANLGRNLQLCHLGSKTILRQASHFGELKVGEPGFLYNSAGRAEIFVNQGSAREVLKLLIDDKVSLSVRKPLV